MHLLVGVSPGVLHFVIALVCVVQLDIFEFSRKILHFVDIRRLSLAFQDASLEVLAQAPEEEVALGLVVLGCEVGVFVERADVRVD